MCSVKSITTLQQLTGVLVQSALRRCTHVFVHSDPLRRPLEMAEEGAPSSLARI